MPNIEENKGEGLSKLTRDDLVEGASVAASLIGAAVAVGGAAAMAPEVMGVAVMASLVGAAVKFGYSSRQRHKEGGKAELGIDEGNKHEP
jgi:hypothetical protein